MSQITAAHPDPFTRAQCSSCQRDVAPNPEGRTPPWCPFCGGDLKTTKALPASPTLQLVDVARIAESNFGGVSDIPTPELQPASVSEHRPCNVDDLGPPEQVYRSSSWRQAVCWLCALVCFVIAGFGGYAVVNHVGKNYESAGYVAGLFIVMGLVSLYVALSMAELSYLVFADAFAEKRGKQVRIIRWEQVREVHETLHPAWRTFRVVTRKGFDLQLTSSTRGHVQLAERIQHELQQRLWPLLLAELERGGVVRFGPLSVSRAGLQADDVASPWYQTTMSIGLNMEPVMGSVYSNLMHLHIYTQAQTKAIKIELSKIPNFRLFLELVRESWPQCLPAGV